MFGIQPFHWLIIAVVALIIFGPKRLPEIGRGLAKAFRELRSGVREASDGFHDEMHPEIEKPTAATTVTATAPPVAEPAGAFCTKCGAPNQSDSLYCHKCGNKLAA